MVCMPAERRTVPSLSRPTVAAHWPDQPTAEITPPPFHRTLNSGQAPEEDRPPDGANSICLPGGIGSSSGSQSSTRHGLPTRRSRVTSRAIPVLTEVSTPLTRSRIGVGFWPLFVKWSVHSTAGVSR